MATRRGVMQAILGGGLMAAASSGAKTKQAGGAPSGNVPEGKYAIPSDARVKTRPLGRTGVEVSILGLGGYHLGLPKDEQESLRIVRTALDHGMNFLDNCWDYNDGKSEERMGKALLGGYREKAFLMTKLDGRTAESTRGQLEQSLKRLQTEMIDLVQIHEVIRDDDPERCFAKGGTIEALLAAKKAGKLRFIGFTGHKDPRIHRHMIETARANGFQFDTVQMPVNVLDAHYRSFAKEIIPLAQAEGIGVLGMKSLGAGLILESGAASALECLRYAMSVPGISVTITGCDSAGVLEQALFLGANFAPMTGEEQAKLLARTAPQAQNGKWEKFKTTQDFDGTEQHKQWLTSAQL
jgi:aryl-alcohol dehydrogenase-like predicted oxidoreductase